MWKKNTAADAEKDVQARQSKMFRLLQVGDEHLSDIAPVRRADNYTEAILNKEREIVSLAKELKVDAVVRNGDIFHIKASSKVSHRLVSSVIAIWKEIPCRNFGILGNHDLSNDLLESLPGQPIQSLIASSVLELIPETGGPPLVLGGVSFSGIYGYGEPDGENKDRYKVSQGEKTNVLVTHSFLLPEKTKFPGVVKTTNITDIADCGADLVLAGHIHSYFGVSRCKDLYLSMPGSISRGSIKEYDADRMPIVTLVEISGKGNFKFEEIPLKSARPNKEIFKPELFDSDIDTLENISSPSVANFIDLKPTREFSLDSEIQEALKTGKIKKEPGEYLLSI